MHTITKPYFYKMNGFDIVMVIAIILFARLGVRLVTGYIKMRKQDNDQNNDESIS